MSLKICYNNQIYKVSKLPSSFTSLTEIVTSFFNGQIPESFKLHYIDSEEDMIMLAGEQDYQILIEDQVKSSNKATKIYVTLLSDNLSEANHGIQPAKEEFEVIEKLKPVAQASAILEGISDEKEQVQQVIEEKQSEIKLSGEDLKDNADIKNQKGSSELKDLIIDVIYQQLPIIASLTKELLQEGQSKIEQPKPKGENLTHNKVKCDGCGVIPIVGIRYKCSVCHNFDFCEKCESTVDHSHTFLKMRKPNQSSPFPFPGLNFGNEQANFNPLGLFENFTGERNNLPNILASFFEKPSQPQNEDQANEFSKIFEKLQEKLLNLNEKESPFPSFLGDIMNSVIQGLTRENQNKEERKDQPKENYEQNSAHLNSKLSENKYDEVKIEEEPFVLSKAKTVEEIQETKLPKDEDKELKEFSSLVERLREIFVGFDVEDLKELVRENRTKSFEELANMLLAY